MGEQMRQKEHPIHEDLDLGKASNMGITFARKSVSCKLIF